MDGQVAGYAGVWLVLCEAHVSNVAVHPDWRGRGIGRALMLALMRTAYQERAATEMTLEVRPSNATALALYQSMGFETFGRRKRYYPDGEDALILWCRDTRPNIGL